MIKKRYLFLLLLIIIINFSVNIINTNYEKKIIQVKKEIEKLSDQVELMEINWTYITRPENLKNINKKGYNLEPIKLNDLIESNLLNK
tara:strand:- start:1202 stop:1465 length:264 start_codon:yes stop_codon:yes gene_type:complete